MKVAAIIVTRGDQTEGVRQILSGLPSEWQHVVWDNGARKLYCDFDRDVPDLAVYGRYAAIEYTDADLIYVQDDDCVVSDPQAIVDAWLEIKDMHIHQHREAEGVVVCNMPANFRARHFYDEHSLVGFGAVFHRDAPGRAFERFFNAMGATLDYRETALSLAMANHFGFKEEGHFLRTCDVVFTALTPRVLVDIEYEDMPWASADNRMWRQPWHQEIRNKMLGLVLEVRDAK